jgi:PAS domain-containing protein
MNGPQQQAGTLIVGLGASTGGFEPLERFLSRVPAMAGLIFVVVQHLEPHHPSLLAGLLTRRTALPVTEATDGLRPEPNHVYVIVPGTLLTLENGVFRVVAGQGPTARTPVDTFFRSLAQDQGEHAVGIVLSGAGHDGTVGLRAIKQHGGLPFAQAPETTPKVVRDGVAFEVDDSMRLVRLVVRPLLAVDVELKVFLVVIQEGTANAEPADADAADAGDVPAVAQLENELRETRAELKTAVEELESANEELKSSNEELTFTNEELETVNAELSQKLDDLGAANSDLQNLFSATEIATVFLDRTLRIVKFTPAATTLFHLIDSDVGRPLADLTPRFAAQDLVSDAREVLRQLAPIKHELRSVEGRWFALRLLPYRTIENLIAGVVITFVDVSEVRRAEETARQQTSSSGCSRSSATVRGYHELPVA